MVEVRYGRSLKVNKERGESTAQRFEILKAITKITSRRVSESRWFQLRVIEFSKGVR